MLSDDRTLTPRIILDTFADLYERVHGRKPSVRYMGNHWYSIDGETVHRDMLFREIERLNDLVKARSAGQFQLSPAALEETNPAQPVTRPPQRALPRTGPLSSSPIPVPVQEPAYAGAGMPAAPINRGLIQKLIDRLRRL